MHLSCNKIITAKKHIRSPWLAVLLTLVLIASFTPLIIGNAPRATAATCTGGGWSDLHWKSDSPNVKDGKYIGPGGHAEVEFKWTAPKGAKRGDSFELDLPEQLRSVDTGPIVLQDENGAVVATGKWVGNKFVITLTGFQEINFDVNGSAYVSVAWNTNKDFTGDLVFNGCGNGKLPGEYKHREGGLFHDDSKIGEYIGFDEKTGNHKIQWSVGIDSRQHQNEHTDRKVRVTDKAPKGWQFTCDFNDNNGYAPVYVSSFIQKGQPATRHVIYNANGHPQGGQREGFTNINAENDRVDGFQPGNHYKIFCSSSEVTVEFPYGLYKESAPVLTITAVTKDAPQPGSNVINKAMIDNVGVEGSVRFPSAGGLGRGKRGGFTVEKNVVGTEEDKAREFTFEYKCTHPSYPNGERNKNGEVKVGNGSVVHVMGLEKNLKCTITEITPPSEKGKKLTTSWVVFDADKNVKIVSAASMFEFTVDELFKEATQILVTNKYERETGGFRLRKLAHSTDEEGNLIDQESKFQTAIKDKTFSFPYICTLPAVNGKEGEKREGTIKLKNGQTSSDVTDLPIGTECTVTENTEGLDIDGYQHKKVNWLEKDGTPNGDTGYTFTITGKPDSIAQYTAVNIYDPKEKPKPETGGFTLKKEVKGLEDDKTFKFSWICNGDHGTTPTRGETTLKNGEEHKVDGLPLESTCRVSETNASVSGYDHTLKWFIDDKPATPVAGGTIVMVNPRSKDKAELVVTAVNSYTPVVPPAPPTTTETTTTTTTTETTTESTTSTTTTTEPTTSSSTTTTTTEPTTEPTTSSSTTTTTTEPTTSSSTTTTEPTTSSSVPPTTTTSEPTTVPTTTTTESTTTSSSVPPSTTTSPSTSTTTPKIPPIIPIPIPIPPAPQPVPPAPHPTPSVTTPPVATPTTQASTPQKPDTQQRELARTGASVIWMLLAAVLLAGTGGVIVYFASSKKRR
ncbi:DUF5979 domain-containing protein [Corynebacterium kutscheri]